MSPSSTSRAVAAAAVLVWACLGALLLTAPEASAGAAAADDPLPYADGTGPGSDAVVAIDARATRSQTRAIERSLRRSKEVAAFTVLDRREARDEIARQVPDVSLAPVRDRKPIPALAYVTLAPDARASAWRRSVESLPGVASVSLTPEGAPDILGLYAGCVHAVAHGWTHEVLMEVTADAAQVAAVESELMRSGATNIETLSQDAAYAEFRRIVGAAVAASYRPADLWATIGFGVPADRADATTATLAAMPAVDEVLALPLDACVTRARSR